VTQSRRPSLLHVGKYYPPHVGGIETHLRLLCRELSKSFDLRVIVASHASRDEEAVIDGVPVVRLATRINLAGAPICPAMARRIRAADADLVHLHLPNPPAVLAYLMSGHRGALVVTWHSDVVRQKILGAAFDPIQRRMLGRCGALIATSPNYVDSSPVLSRHRELCRVVPYGIEVERWRGRDPGAAELRLRYGARTVLAVGRLVYYKGFEHIIRAMTAIDATLLIAGDGPLRSRLEHEARELGVAERVVFVGEVRNDRMAPYYQGSDLLVLPSVARSEAFGIVQLEAMACARPVVNTRLASGVPYVSLDGVTGLTVPPADSAALAAAINRLLNDDALRTKFGRAAVERVETEFTIDRMVRRTVEVYEQVLGRSRGDLGCARQGGAA
jgi:glycosyltransferase involved in cell wall biosynthesis